MSTGSATQTDVDCPEGPFETDAAKIAQRALKETPANEEKMDGGDVPIEISRLAEGGLSFVRGGIMDGGMRTWYAFDLERYIFIAVLSSTDPLTARVPSPDKLKPNQYLRRDGGGNRNRTDYVTVVNAQPTQIRTFACLANKLLASERESLDRPLPMDVMKRQFSLLHGGQSLDLGEGRRRWEIEGELVQFISQPLQETLLNAL